MGRSPCCSKEGLNRGAWSAEEDKILSDCIRIHGDRGWRNLAEKAGLIRCGKSCRLRWVNYLRPGIKRGNITPDEEDLIIRLHRLLGNRWSLIAGRLPERTDNEIKNYWNIHLTKKMLSMNQAQHNGTKKLKKRSKSLALKNPVMKTSPAGVKMAVRDPEIVGLKGSNGYDCNYPSSDKAFKLFNVKEIANSSESCSDLPVNDTIIGDDSDSIAFAAADNLAEAEARDCSLSMSSLADERYPNSHYFAGLPERLLSLNELTSSDCNLLSSPSDSGSEQFSGRTATLAAEKNKFEVECPDQSSTMQGVNSFFDVDDQGMEDFFDKTQQVDWIHELDLE